MTKSITWRSIFATSIFSIVGILLTSVSFSPVSYAVQSVPYQMNFQGRLNDSTGAPMPNGTYNMKFRIYSVASGGSSLWSEQRSVFSGTGVTITTGGLFSVQLGSVTSLPPSIFNSASPLYLEVELPTPATATCSTSGCESYTEGAMTPRNPVESSPYAINSDLLDGMDSSAFATATGGSGYIQNQNASAQGANFWINGTGQIGGNLTANAQVLFKNGTNSASAFQIQNAAGGTILSADTTANQTNVVGNLNLSQVSSPTSAPTAALGAAGSLTGTYYYVVTFVTASGETTYGPQSAAISPSSQQVNLTSIQTSSSSLVTARKIYRGANGGPYYLVGTIADNTTTTFTDNNTSPGAAARVINSTANLLQNGSVLLQADSTNVSLGLNSLPPNTLGTYNTAVGAGTLSANTSGVFNSAFGNAALIANTSGTGNTAQGYGSLYLNTTGGYNTAQGTNSLGSNTTGNFNMGSGYTALYNNTTGSFNAGYGALSLRNNTTGQYNSALGAYAGYCDVNNTTFCTGATIQNSTAVGALSQVQASNSLVLGSVDLGTKVGIGTTVPSNLFSVSPVDLNSTSITASQTSGSGTITASSAIFSAANVGEILIWSDGTTETITAYTDSTHVTGSSTTVTETAKNFRTHVVGFQVTSTGNTYVQNNSATAFQVQNAAGTAIFSVNTTGSSVTLSAGSSLTLTGGATATRPSSPTEGMMYYDTTTHQLLTYSNGKWQASSKTATVVVAAGSSTQAAKDSAQYVGNGTNDDVAINAAIAALPAGGGTVVLLEGTYNISATINVNLANTTILGQGPSTILKRMYNAAAAGDGVVTVAANYVAVRNVYINGNSGSYTNANNDGIYKAKSRGNYVIADSTITANAGNGLDMDGDATLGNNFGQIINDKVTSNSGKGIYLIYNAMTKVTGNQVDSNTGNGIDAGNNSANNTITDNSVQSNSGVGINMGSGDHVTSNMVASSGTYGIIFQGFSSGGEVSANYVSGGTYGIGTNPGANDDAITGNTITSTSSDGIYINNGTTSRRITITGNSIYNAGANGINANSTVDSLIGNNNIYNSGGSGSSSGISIGGATNTITGNRITDTAGTGYAISVGGTQNYLSVNTYSGTGASSINDTGTKTIWSNQLEANGNIINNNTGSLTIGTSTVAGTLSIQGGITTTQLPTPAAPTITTAGTAGTTNYSYAVTALDGTGETLASTAGSTTTGNATLSGTNYTIVTWTQISGATSYKVYRTASGGSPATTGYIGTVTSVAGVTNSFNDTGLAASSALPTTNTTGGIQAAGNLYQNGSAINGQFIQNTTSTQTGNFHITGSGVASTLQAGNFDAWGAIPLNFGQTNASSINIGNTSSNIATMINGTTVVKTTAANVASAFQVQNASGSSLFNVDTLNNNISLLGNNSPTLSTWNTTTAMSIGANTARVRGGAIASNGYLYYLGGVDGTGTTIATVQYAKLNANGTVGTWNSTTALPSALKQFQPVIFNGYIYVIGGRNNSNTVQSTSYYAKLNNDGTIGAWNTTTNLTAARFGQGSFAYNGYMYVVGGFDSTTTVQTTDYYARINGDGTLGSWSTTTALSAGVATINGSTVVANGYAYIVGGWTGSTTTSNIMYAKLNIDGTIGAWTTQTAALTGGGDEDWQTFVSNGYLYAIGGDSGARVLALQLGATGALGTATTLAAFPQNPMGEAFGATANGYFYLLGGSSALDGGGTVYNSVYYASTSRVQVGGNLDLVGYSGQNLAEGGTGGQLTAGNTSIVGTLQVQDAATFARNVAIGGTLTAAGPVMINPSTNTTNAFQVQAQDGNSVLRVDTTNERVAIGVISDPINAKLNIATGTTVALRAYQSSTYDIFQLANATGDVFNVTNTGNVTVKPNTNSTTAFQIQNAANSAILTADTTANQTNILGNLNLSQVSAPTSAPTVAVGAAGSLTGTFYYVVTYVTASGETGYGTASSAVSPSSQQVNLTAIPVSPSNLVTARKIYRGAAGGPYYLVGTIANNTATTFTDNNTSPGAAAKAINGTASLLQNGSVILQVDAGTYNTATGPSALQSNTTGSSNTALGNQTLYSNTTGYQNTATGDTALYSNTTGWGNTASGEYALGSNTTGNSNDATGYNALSNNTTGSQNTASGRNSLSGNTTGSNNTASGYGALSFNTTGSQNTALGYNAGYCDATNTSMCTGSALQNSTAIGAYSQVTASNSLVLGSVDQGTKIGIGITSPTNLFSVSPLDYQTGTVTRTNGSATLAGTGTTWTAAMVGDIVVFADGTTSTITGFTGATSVTMGTTYTGTTDASPIAYRFHKVGFQVTSAGNAYIQNSSTTAFQVQNASGGTIFSTDTTANQTNIIGNLNLTQVAAPSSAPTVAVGAAGSLTGTFYYVVTYVTASGETAYGTASSAVSPSSQQVNLTAIPTSASNLVTARRIYRGTSVGGPFNLVTTINNNTATTYTDNITSLGNAAKTINGTASLLQNGATFLQSDASSYNVSLGSAALTLNTAGTYNVAIGGSALYNNTTGSSNIAVGSYTLTANTSGFSNVGVGGNALVANTTGANNSALGLYSLSNNVGGNGNTALGYNALYKNTSGSSNTAIGNNAGYCDATNTAFCTSAAIQNASAIGANAQVQANNSLVLGSVDQGTKVGIGITVPSNLLSVSPVDLNSNTITATQSGTTVTASSAIFSAANVGEILIWSDGSTNTITGYTSTTQVTVQSSASRATGSNFRTHRVGFQVTSAGNAYVQNNATTAFQVQTATGGVVLNTDTTTGQVSIGTAGASTGTLSLQGGLTTAQLSAPNAPTVTNGGTAGAVSYSYAVTAIDGVGETTASSNGTTATGNATLTASNYNVVTWTKVTGATSYKVYRTASSGTPATTGLIGTVTSSGTGATMSLNDTGLAASTAAPAANTTGSANFASQVQIGSATTGLRLTSSALTFGDGTGWTFNIKGGGNTLATFADNGGLTLQKTTTINGGTTGLLVTTGTTASGAVGALQQGNAATGDFLDLLNASGLVRTKFNNNGDLIIGGANSATSANALQVQNTSGVSLLTVSSSANQVTIGTGATGNTTGYNLVLDNKTNAGDPTGVTGAMYYNSSTGNFRCYQASAWQNCASGALYSVTADSTTINGGTVGNQNLSTTYTVPANYCTAGRVIHITADGVTTSGTTAQPMRFDVYMGSVALTDTTPGNNVVTPSASGTNLPWNVEYNFTCRTAPGASATVYGQGVLSIKTAAGTSAMQVLAPTSATGATVATNAAQAIALSITFGGTASASNTLTLKQMYVNSF